MDASAAVARDRVPILFRVARAAERRRIRGSTRLLGFLNRVGYLDYCVDFRLSDSIGILVPLARMGLDQTDVETYEEELLTGLESVVRPLPPPVTLLDGGADIGLFSLKLLSACPGVSRVVAVEPNAEGFSWLQRNLSRLPHGVESRAVHAALADYAGRGRLAAPESRFLHGLESYHTDFFLERCDTGPIAVTTIDALGLPPRQSLVIKLDVEGGELAALRGATHTISEASALVVVAEANPWVAERTGIDPVEFLSVLAALRAFRFTVGETGQVLNTGRPVFDQIPPERVYNILAESR